MRWCGFDFPVSLWKSRSYRTIEDIVLFFFIDEDMPWLRVVLLTLFSFTVSIINPPFSFDGGQFTVSTTKTPRGFL